MANKNIKYIIEVLRKGTGAKDAARDLKEFDKASDSAAKSSKNLSKNVGGDKGVIGSFRKLLAAGVVVKAGQLLKDFALSSVMLASDVGESMSKATVVFGDFFDETAEALDEFGNKVNRSKFELIDMAASIQDTFVPLGFAREEAAGLSIDLTKLAVDVASFNNTLDSDTMRDFQSAIVGNHETVRKYGVIITESTLKQKAFELGMWDGTTALTEQEKALIRYQIILEGTTDAHGDAALTSDQLANSSRGLAAAWMEYKVEVAQGALPVTSELVQLLTGYIDRSANAARLQRELSQAIADGTMTQREASDVNSGLQTGMVSLAEATAILEEAYAPLNARLAEASTYTDGWAEATARAADAAADANTYTSNLSSTAENSIFSFDIAKATLMTYEQAIRSVTQSEIEAMMVKNQLLLMQDGLTEAERIELEQTSEQLGILQLLNDASDTGIISKETLIEILADQKVTEEELHSVLENSALLVDAEKLAAEGLIDLTNENWIPTTEDIEAAQKFLGDETGESTQAIFDQIDAINRLIGAWDRLSSAQSSAGAGVPGVQIGDHTANAAGTTGFTVPPGYNNDNFMMGVRSGEHVTVTQPDASRPIIGGQPSGGGSVISISMSIHGGNNDPATIAAMVEQRLRTGLFAKAGITV